MPKAGLPFDLDDIFAYKTKKVVRIRDRRLGIAKLLITIGIFVYVVIFEAIINQGYLSKEEPQGAVLTTLRRPIRDLELSSYCRVNGSAPSTEGGDTLPCEWLDEIDALFPAGEELGSMFITTRISYVTKPAEANCPRRIYDASSGDVRLVSATTGQNCEVPQVYDQIRDEDIHYYVAEIENFTMRWTHSVYGTESQDVRSFDELRSGTLEMPDGQEELDFTKDDRTVSGSGIPAAIARDGYVGTSAGDILSMGTLARALNFEGGYDRVSDQVTNLDCTTSANFANGQCDSGCHYVGPRCYELSVANCDPNTQPCLVENATCVPKPEYRQNVCPLNSVRYDGGVVLVLIDYKTPRLSSGDLEYVYRVNWLPKAEYKVISKVYSNNGNTVTYWNRHGIRVLFVQTGFFTKFAFVELLKTLVAGVTLFAISDVVVELLIMKLLKGKHIYENFKYLTTPDFSVVNVTPDKPFGGLISEDFVYGVNRPGHAPALTHSDKCSEHDAPLDEDERKKQYESTKPTEPTTNDK